jgi:nitrite reductase/ring-hydroxylating ferredoxin subunit
MGPVRANLLLESTPAGRHGSADTTDWTGTWVCVGFADQLTEVGAVLPATVGHHAAHVRRTGEGLTAAINARPFGGCMSIPVHCGSTRNVRCPHLACAFSEDGGVLDSTADPSGRARAEFVGDGRRTVGLPLARWGPLLFLNVTLEEPPPLPVAAADPPGQVATIGSQLMPGHWLTTPQRAASAVARALGADAEPVTVAPNLAVVSWGAAAFTALSRPAGPTRSTVVWGLHATLRGGKAIDDGLIRSELCAMSRRT